ncbi:cupin domain-containing protein [Pseudomonadota bacterium]
MFKVIKLSILVILVVIAGCVQKEMGVMKFPDGKAQHVVRADRTDWKPCPSNLPSGCKIAILEGHPKKPDLFTVRFKVDKIFFMPAHTHPKDERVTIITGKAAVGFGKDAKREQATEFGPGDYYVNARNAVHVVWVEGPTVIQITGIGPWQANFINKANK